ncbi:MAG: amidophosphoribosyltransferase [Mogibacterium sp.]|nr:amidophosphoribosyltransferase [Mogibacterium sp.]MBR2539233.1 amidophosphoribosyltransferase [Mogibacterium sp.]
MGGFFGITSTQDCILDVYFGVDYHSHLGTRRGGIAAYDPEVGLQREIHNIENAPFRTKFEGITNKMHGTAAIGCISDTDPQPLLFRSVSGTYAITMIGKIANQEEIIDLVLKGSHGHLEAKTGGKINQTELVAALISEKDDLIEGIRYAQEAIEGTSSLLLLKEDGTIIAARDLVGRLPIRIGIGEHSTAAAFESFTLSKMGYENQRDLGPGEIVELRPDGVRQLVAPGDKMRICAFLWSYYGYPTTSYEGVNVEMMRYENGRILARNDIANGFDIDSVDYVGGVPDSGTPHGIGYANETHVPFARAFIKYTPTWARSFMPTTQAERNKVAKMKQIPVTELIKDKSLLFVDDSIVRGTQLQETVDFLYDNGAKAVHMRSACPPLMYACKYLNFSRNKSDMDLLSRRVVMQLEGEQGLEHLDEYADASTARGRKFRETIAKKMGFETLEFQTLDGVCEAIGIDKCKLCTYCWSGEE